MRKPSCRSWPTVIPGARSSVAILAGFPAIAALAYSPMRTPALKLSVAKSASVASWGSAGVSRAMTSTPALRAFFTAGTIAFVSLGVIRIALAPPEIMFSMAVTWVALSPSNLPAPVMSVAPFFFAAFWAPSFIFTKNGFTSVLVMSPTTTLSALNAGNAAQSRESRRRVFTFMLDASVRGPLPCGRAVAQAPAPRRRWDEGRRALPEEIPARRESPWILTRRARPIRVRRSQKPERRTQDASLSVCSRLGCRGPGCVRGKHEDRVRRHPTCRPGGRGRKGRADASAGGVAAEARRPGEEAGRPGEDEGRVRQAGAGALR